MEIWKYCSSNGKPFLFQMEMNRYVYVSFYYLISIDRSFFLKKKNNNNKNNNLNNENVIGEDPSHS
jgi:hypothetical protein